MTGSRVGNRFKVAKRKAPFLLVLSIALGLLLLMPNLLFIPSFNAPYLNKLFLQHADLSVNQLDANQLPQIANGLADYLSGRQGEGQVILSQDGMPKPAFQEHELQHLKDIRHLVLLSQVLSWLALAILLGSIAYSMLRYRGQTLSLIQTLAIAWRRAAILLSVLLLLMTIFVLIDFSSAFVLLHELVFQNDLWLLNPAQDLLIQLMPEPFFTEYALKAMLNIGLLLGFSILLPSFVLIWIRKMNRNGA